MYAAYKHTDGSGKAATVPSLAWLDAKPYVDGSSVEIARLPEEGEAIDPDTLTIVQASTLIPLATYKVTHIVAIKAEIDAALEALYPALDLSSLLALYNDARADGLVNREAYLKTLRDWTRQLYPIFYTARNAAMAATTHAEVDAVTINLTSWIAANPGVTYEAAIAIPN